MKKIFILFLFLTSCSFNNTGNYWNHNLKNEILDFDKEYTLDEYKAILKKYNAKTAGKLEIKHGITANPNIAPIAVANPIPPLNFRNIGNQCPFIVDKATRIKIMVGEPIYCTKITGKAPLRKSNVKTVYP